MIVARESREIAGIEGPLALTLGVFDGVHRGHQDVVARLREEAAQDSAFALVVTFDPHPVEVLREDARVSLLTTPAERVSLLERFAPDGVFVYPFDRETASLAPLEFLDRIVPPRARLTVLVIGYDFRMGKGRSGGLAELTEEGERLGFRVVAVGPTRRSDDPVSSTRIRSLVAEGRVREASELLGHRFLLAGPVVPGRGIGRRLKFPTANVDVEDDRKLLPAFGVYAVLVRPRNGEPDGLLPGVMNLGVRPTFGATDPVLEVHLLGFTGDLSGRTLEVELVERIRDEKGFDGEEALAAQIARDVSQARRILETARE